MPSTHTSTQSAGSELRFTPECLMKMLAIGQPSTDSIHARWKTSGASGAARQLTLDRLIRGRRV